MEVVACLLLACKAMISVYRKTMDAETARSGQEHVEIVFTIGVFLV